MTMRRPMAMVIIALRVIAVLLFISGSASTTVTSLNISSLQENSLELEDDEDAIQLRKLLGPVVDTLVIERYKNVESGFRKHPSYYSETYLRRARTLSSAEQSKLKKWGEWTFIDTDASSRPNNQDFYKGFSNRDVPRDKFPAKSWQTDKTYLSRFLPEAIKLTERALEAILSEYGQGKDDKPGNSFEERSVVFQPSLDGGPGGGGGKMTKLSYEGLKRRVLHAVMTEDRFTVAMSGHSAAAGHGNHFQQTYTLQVQRILEPIFARLGVKMSGRNFGMGGLGTRQNTIGGGDIFGKDVDVLLWDSGMTEKDQASRGMMGIQGLLGIDRAPFLWFERDSGELKKIHELTNADIGVYGSFGDFVTEPVSNMKELEKLPWALRFKYCPKVMKDYCNSLRYNGTCWIDRTEFQWGGMDLSFTPPSTQQSVPGGRASWHPGNREHQLTGRSFTFTILLALRDGLKMWNEATDYAIEDEAWHVTNYYNSIKSKVVENKDSWVRWCKEAAVPEKFCMYGAQARTEFTPRNRPWATSLRAIMDGSQHPDIALGKNWYDPPDMYNPTIDPPEGEIDVLAIVENGVDFVKNLARMEDSAQNMDGPDFSKSKPKTKGAIVGGTGWQLENKEVSAGTDNCDGEYDSWCHRSTGCLLYGHNDNRGGIIFDGYSGWLMFKLPKVQHGLIMIKFHSWAFHPPDRTQGWCSENNKEPCKGRALSSTPENSSNHTSTSTSLRRRLKPPVPQFCDDFKFEFVINGKLTTWDLDTFRSKIKSVQRVVECVTLMDDDSWKGSKDVDLAIRLTGCGRQKPFSLTHIYWI